MGISCKVDISDSPRKRSKWHDIKLVQREAPYKRLRRHTKLCHEAAAKSLTSMAFPRFLVSFFPAPNNSNLYTWQLFVWQFFATLLGWLSDPLKGEVVSN